MSAATLDAPITSRPDTDGEVCHLVCDCDEDTARCGMDVSDHQWMPDSTIDCVVCVDLPPCGSCGY